VADSSSVTSIPVHSIATFRADLGDHLQRFRRLGSDGSPVVVGRDATPEAVLVPHDVYRALLALDGAAALVQPPLPTGDRRVVH
jgi:hypothetical protein